MFTNSNLSITSKNSLGTLKNGAIVNLEEFHYERKQSGMTMWLWLTTAAVLLCSAVPTGYNIGVVNPPQAILQRFCNETVYLKYDVALSTSGSALLWSAVVSIYLIGMMIGSLTAGWLCNTFGRKGAIMHVNWLGMLAAVLFGGCRAASSVEMLLVGRLLVGVFSGFSLSALPLYLGEISPARLRGAFGVLQPLGMTFGLVLALALGLDKILGTEDSWPYLLSLFGLPIALFTVVLFFCPESPKYLFVVRKNSEQSIKELCRLRNASPEQLEDEILEMKQDVRQDMTSSSWSFWQVVSSKESRGKVGLLCILHAGQQLSGINAVFYYSTSIFSSAGMNQEQSQYASIGAGFANFLMAAVSTWLVSRFNRRPLFMFSLMGTIVCLIGLSTSFHFMESADFAPFLAVVFLLLFVLTYGVGLGPIPYFLGNELLSTGPRPMGMSIGCAVNGASNFLVGLCFPTVQAALAEFSFLIFVGFSALVLVVTYLHMPETRRKEEGGERQLQVTISFQDSRIVMPSNGTLDDTLTPINHTSD